MRPRRVRYGPGRAQRAELWMPRHTPSAPPVVVMIHGGYWKAIYTKRLMHPLARAVVAQGVAVYNIEYRRIGLGGGGGGYPQTYLDVAAAIDHLATLDAIDAARVITCGHSAGGTLALWAAARHRLPGGVPGAAPTVRLRGAVSLAGVVDLAAAARLGLGAGATERLMGGSPDARADAYAVASPAALRPVGVPQVLLHGTEDTVVPMRLSVDYAAGGGADTTCVVLDGVTHLGIINPRGPVWPPLTDAISSLVG